MKNYKESEWVKLEYSSMSEDRLRYTVQNREYYLAAHADRCLKELQTRKANKQL